MRDDSTVSLPDMVVLCGGKGSRLGALTAAVPKPLLPVGGSPFLLRLLLQWRKEGVRRFILAVHHLVDRFRDFAEEHAPLVGKMDVVVEKEPLGTGGGLKNAARLVKTPTFLAANGDSYVSQPLSDVLMVHDQSSNGVTLVAVAPGHVMGGARQKGQILVGPKGNLTGFATEENVTDGWVNAGLYAIRLSEIAHWPKGRFDLEKAVLPDISRHTVGIFRSSGNLLDIGIPECYALSDQKLGSLDLLFSRIDKT